MTQADVFEVDPFAFDDGPATSDNALDQSQALEDTLARLMTSFNTLAECVANVDPAASEERLMTPAGLPGYTVTQIIHQLRNLNGFAASMQDVTVPLNAVNLIDQGRNPNLNLKTMLERVAADNQYTNGALTALADYRNDLKEGLEKEFPALTLDFHQSSNHEIKEEQTIKLE